MRNGKFNFSDFADESVSSQEGVRKMVRDRVLKSQPKSLQFVAHGMRISRTRNYQNDLEMAKLFLFIVGLPEY